VSPPAAPFSAIAPTFKTRAGCSCDLQVSKEPEELRSDWTVGVVEGTRAHLFAAQLCAPRDARRTENTGGMVGRQRVGGRRPREVKPGEISQAQWHEGILKTISVTLFGTGIAHHKISIAAQGALPVRLEVICNVTGAAWRVVHGIRSIRAGVNSELSQTKFQAISDANLHRRLKVDTLDRVVIIGSLQTGIAPTVQGNPVAATFSL